MLQDRAMITNLTIRQWTGQKLDRKISQEVDAQHGAKDAGKYTKWIVDKVELDALSKHAGQVRDLHYEMTLPWGDNGDRLLPSRMYMKYTDKMRLKKQERETLAKEFAAKYPAMVAAGPTRLGSMFDIKDFPAVQEIEHKFGIELSFLPVPDAKDFRVDVGNDAVEEIKASITASVKLRQDEAIADCWSRLDTVVSKIVARLSDPEAVFRDSLIENAAFAAEIIPDLNITDDKKLEHACLLLSALASINPAAIRRSKVRRQDVCDRAAHLLDMIRQSCIKA